MWGGGRGVSLSPASEGWGRYCFQFVSSHLGDTYSGRWGGGYLPRTGGGGLHAGWYTPRPPLGDRAAQRALATLMVVCLLRSRRKTFSFIYVKRIFFLLSMCVLKRKRVKLIIRASCVSDLPHSSGKPSWMSGGQRVDNFKRKFDIFWKKLGPLRCFRLMNNM